MSIPIKNIYYLLCYSWDKLEEGEKVFVSASDYDESINLFAKVLVNGCRHLFKKGLSRNYIEVHEEYVGIKGKIDFKESLNKNLFKQGKSVCTFDQFESNILLNQLLKGTLKKIYGIIELDVNLRHEIYDCYRKLNNVDDIEPKLILFDRVKIHRNNSFYDLLLKICKLIIENIVLDESTGRYHFRDFLRSEKAMASLFESFVRNFYKKEQHNYIVRRENIEWEARAVQGSSESYLPIMQTDISLESDSRKIIIETKYYLNALTSRFEAEKINSNNLYQLYSYLRNIENKPGHIQNKNCEGILLYPTVDYSLNETFIVGSHFLRIRTINLNQEWRIIKEDLLNIVQNNISSN